MYVAKNPRAGSVPDEGFMKLAKQHSSRLHLVKVMVVIVDVNML